MDVAAVPSALRKFSCYRRCSCHVLSMLCCMARKDSCGTSITSQCYLLTALRLFCRSSDEFAKESNMGSLLELMRAYSVLPTFI